MAVVCHVAGGAPSGRSRVTRLGTSPGERRPAAPGSPASVRRRGSALTTPAPGSPVVYTCRSPHREGELHVCGHGVA
eukprot:gene3173-66704_t